jgi:hypothetical protein
MGDDFNKEMCEREHVHVEDRLTKMEKVVDKIRDRLPVWATLLLMALTAALGYTLKH